MKTPIEWTEETWNPVRGCSRISPGCVNCYAERQAARSLPGMKSPITGEPFAIMTAPGPRWTGNVEFIPSMLDVPLRRKKATVWFVNSMSDLFHEDLPDEVIDRVFAVMALCPQHTFQVLTKRAERMREYFADLTYRQDVIGIRAEYMGGDDRYTDDMLPRWPLPFSNVWLGVSAENQEYADLRIPHLLKTPAAVRFVSYEPALGPVDFTHWLRLPKFEETIPPRPAWNVLLDWLIVGGESGPGARPFRVEWAQNAVAQCRESGVAVFVKQMGSCPVVSSCEYYAWDPPLDFEMPAAYRSRALFDQEISGWHLNLRDKKGGSMEEWPDDLRIREMPSGRSK